MIMKKLCMFIKNEAVFDKINSLICLTYCATANTVQS